MGTCVICGTDVDGHVCASHEEDVCFEFTGTRPDQLQSNRFYQGTVDGYADFGVFVDIGDRVTGLLHRSELPRRLESLDWEPGDQVFVQVTNVRDNGNVDLGWSIRQATEEFRGHLVHTPEGDELPDADGGDVPDESAASTEAHEAGNEHPAGGRTPAGTADEPADTAASPPSATESAGTDPAGAAPTAEPAEVDQIQAESADAEPSEPAAAETEAASTRSTGRSAGTGGDPEPAGGAVVESSLSRSEIASLEDEIGSPVRLSGEVVDIRQTGGPTIFELRDETGAVDCAAFKSPGVRAYPDVEVGDLLRVDGVVEDHRGAVQVEAESLVVLEGDERDDVAERLEAALAERARPAAVDPLADHPAIDASRDALREAATAVRRAVFEARPVVIRHRNSADGYVAAAALERAVLPLVRAEHEERDAEYHYVDRRPLESRVYGLADAMRDVTQLLDAEQRHGEKVPLFVLVGAGATAESTDALDLLAVYGAERVVVDGGYPDAAVADSTETFVSPHLVDAPDAESATTGALCATLAATINPDVRDELVHLPAVSYWRDAPDAYVELAADAGYDAAATAMLREAIALEAYYQVYEDKRELVADLLFGDGGLAEPASEQFRERLDRASRTAEPHLETWNVAGAALGVLDVDAYTHRYDFPPADVLLASLADRAGDLDAVLGVEADELTLWSAAPVDLRAVAETVAETAPDAGVEVRGGRDGSLVFLSGERDAVLEATIQAVADRL
jgi:RecJ-like exonuclease